MDKFLSSHFDSESPEYYPEDFQGAALGDGIIYISSDDDTECASSASVDDLESLSDDDDVGPPGSVCGEADGTSVDIRKYSNPLYCQ